jgi:hypothetical protein
VIFDPIYYDNIFAGVILLVDHLPALDMSVGDEDGNAFIFTVLDGVL